MASKGHRHLSGLALVDRKLEDAQSHLKEAGELANRISDAPKKREALIGLQVNSALLALERQELPRALCELQEAKQAYESVNDFERAVKLYHFIGDVQLAMGHVSDAKDTYRRGLTEAKRHSRRDGVLKNTLGLARVEDKEKNPLSAKALRDQAKRLAEEIGYEAVGSEKPLP